MNQNTQTQSLREESVSEKKETAKEIEKRTPNQELRYFIVQGNEEKVRELQQQGADVNAPDEGEDPNEINKSDLMYVVPKITLDTPLHLAAECDQVKIISQLFYLGAKMENHNRIGSTALHRAVSTNHPAAVTELINLGADVHAKNNIGQTPLHIAAILGNVDMLKLLLKHGAMQDLRVKNKVYLTPIEYTLPNSEARQYLLEVDPGLQDFLGEEEASFQRPQEEKKQQ